MSQNYKADSTAYPYIDDENTPCQFSSATMGSVCTPGQRPNNSIFFGTAPKMGISYVGVDFLVTIDDDTGYETSIAQHTPFVDFRETDSGFGFGDNFSQTITTGVWGPTSPASWNYYFNAGYQANLFRGYQVDYHRLFSGNTTVSWNLTNRTLRYHPMVKPSRKCICLVPHLQVRRELPDNAAIQANPGLIHSWVNDTQTVTVRNYTNNVNNIRTNYPYIVALYVDAKYSTTPSGSKGNNAWFVYNCDFTPAGTNLVPIDPETHSFDTAPPSSDPVNVDNFPDPAGTIQVPMCWNYALFDGVTWISSGMAQGMNNLWFIIAGDGGEHAWDFRWWIEDNHVRYFFGSHAAVSLNTLMKRLDGLGITYTVGTEADAADPDPVNNNTIYMPIINPQTGEIEGSSNDPQDKQDTMDYMDDTGNDDLQPDFDPADPGGGGGGGGGGSDGTDTDDGSDTDPDTDKIEENVPEPDADDVQLSTTDVFYRSFVMSKGQLQQVSDFLWNQDNDVFDNLLEELAMVGQNRCNAIISLVQFPFDVAQATGTTSMDTHVVKLGRVSTHVTGLALNRSFCTVDLGSCTFHGKYKNFLDMEPYTKAWLYIPYCGITQISATQFLNRIVSVKMHIDLVTGSGLAVVYSRDPENDEGNGVPMLYKNCVVGMQIGVTGEQAGYLAQKYVKIATNVGKTAMDAVANPNPAAVAGNILSTFVDAWTGQNAPLESEGSSSPQCSMLTPQQCYLIVERPRLITGTDDALYVGGLTNYGKLVGKACYKGGYVGSFTGFSKFANAKLDLDYATEKEKAEILNLLETGVYV